MVGLTYLLPCRDVLESSHQALTVILQLYALFLIILDYAIDTETRIFMT